MSESGTPLDAIETGEVSNAADASRMANILRDMNASGAEIVGSPSAQPPPQQAMGLPRQPMPPMPPMPQNSMSNPLPPMYNEQQYVPIEEPVYIPKRKNVWGNLLGQLIDPLVVAVLVMVLSLPALHTFVGKYASWAYVLGGQLSWFGLVVKSLLAAVLFGLYKFGSSFLPA